MAYFLSNQISERLQGDTKKPIGNDVEIDWSNPLTKGLISHWSNCQSLRDAVTKLPLTLVNDAVVRGDHIYTDGTGDRVEFDSSLFTSETAFTFIVIYVNKNITDLGQVFGASDDGNNYGAKLITNTGVIHRFRTPELSNTNLDLTTAPVADVVTTLTCAWDGAEKKLILNDFDEKVTAAATGTISWQTGANYNINMGYHNANAVEMEADFYYVSTWNRSLPDAEISSIVKDPYQILKSVRQIHTLIAVDGAPATVIPTNPINGPLKGPLGGPICI